MKLRLILVVCCVFVLAGVASAAPSIIDFSTGAAIDNGTISWAGGSAPLVGSDLGIGQVRGVNTLSNSGLSTGVCGTTGPCPFGSTNGGRLDFTTGTFLGYNAGTDTYSWGAGGSLTITGYTVGCTANGACGGNTSNTQSGPNLLTGNVISASYQDGAFDVVLAAGNDSKDPLLLNFFGLNVPSITGFDFSGSVHAAIVNQPGGAGTAFTADSTASTDIRNQAVPEVSSILLLGTLLSGSMSLLRKKFLKS